MLGSLAGLAVGLFAGFLIGEARLPPESDFTGFEGAAADFYLVVAGSIGSLIGLVLGIVWPVLWRRKKDRSVPAVVGEGAVWPPPPRR